MQSEAFAAHIRWMKIRGLADDTVAQRKAVMRRMAAHFDGKPLLAITEEELTSWAEGLVERLARATRAVYISNVREFYKWCYAEHRIPADPAANLPVPRVSPRKPRPISEDELVLAISQCDGAVRAWLVLAAWCGLRAKEIAWLRAENVRLHSEPPYILVASDATKGRRERIVQLSPFAAEEMERQRLPARGLCWRNARSVNISPGLVSQVCNRYLHGLGIDDTLHTLRHRFGTQVQRAVRDLRVTQELLGHTSPATTAGYTDVSDLDKYRAVSMIPSPQRPDAA